MSNLPDGVVTFLLTDIEGSSPLWDEHPAAMAAAVARHDALAAEVIGARGGTVLKSRGEGDSLFCVFASPSDAVAAALDLQVALIAEPWPDSCRIAARMALATGEAELRDGDYRGPVVNRCARIRAAAHGGQILLAQSTCELVRGALPPDSGVTDLGDRSLTGLKAAERIFQLTHPRLHSAFPPLRAEQAPPTNLPRQLTSFIGRERDIEAATALLKSAPLLTLTGAGGSGKTRLALEISGGLLFEYDGGVWLVELAALSDGAAVLPSVAGVLIRGSTPATEQGLIDCLQAKKTLLLLDNCEHVLPSCRALAHTLLRACPKLTILATSREPLAIQGEAAWPVPTLSTPDPAKPGGPRRLMQFESVRLFAERARAADPAFDITTETATAVASICRQLDGIPLAIELAAARVRNLSIAQIADRLHDRFKLLKSSGGAALPRHQTLEAAVSWSYDLLTEAERALLQRLAVFAGGCTLESAETVCSDESSDDSLDDVLDTISHLTDKSLVTVERKPGGQVRYGMLETIRQFAEARFAASGEADRYRERHRDHFLSLAEEAEPHLQMADQKEWLARLDAEHDNLRAALTWSVDGDYRLRIAAALWRYWYLRGFASEGRSWLEGGLRRQEAASPLLQARALNGAGVLAMAQADGQHAKEHFAACLDLRRSLGDEAGVARALNNLGLIARRMHDYSSARNYYAETIEIWRRTRNPPGLAMALVNLGGVCIDDNDLGTAVDLLEQSLAIYRKLDDAWSLAATLHNLGAAAKEMKCYPAARRYLRESLEIKRTLGDPGAIAISLNSLGATETKLGNHQMAVTLIAASHHVLAQTKGVSPSDEAVDDAKTALATARAALTEDEFAAAWDAGLDLSTSEIVRFAVEDDIDTESHQ